MAEHIKQKIQGGKKSICDSCAHRNVCKAIDNQPCTECNHYQCTVDVEPVKHGRWIEKQEKDTFAGYLYSYECSECERVEQRKEPYCPNCGAKMGDKLYG